MGHLDMTEDRSVEAFDLVLGSCLEVQNFHHAVQLLRGQQLISYFVYYEFGNLAGMSHKSHQQ